MLRNARRTAIGLTLTAILAIIPAISGCSALGSDTTPQNSSNGALEKSSIKVSVVPTTDTAPFWIAQDEGYFKAEGLDVTMDVTQTGIYGMTKVISGEADIANVTYTLMFAAKNTADLRLVADGTSASHQCNVLVTLPNSPVKHIEDLAGHKIAITSKNAASDILTRSALKDHGVDPGKVNFVYMGQPNMGAALQRGDVDAAYMTEPYITQSAKQVGAYSIADVASGASEGFPVIGYTATGKWVQDHPKTLAAFQRAMAKATSAATADRSKVERVVVKYGKVDADTAAIMKLPDFQPPRLDARRIQRVPDAMLQVGALTATVDVARMIAPQATG